MLQPGDTIDIWVVEAALGSGGMGSVYRCRNKSASRILAAIKVLEGGLKRYPEAEARFVREAEILFQLDHPNIVKVRNIRTETDPPYLEMEFVAGEALDERLRRGPMPFEQALAVMRQTADAVQYLHARGVRHRDIKPANVLVQQDGQVKLVDFGLAVEADTTRITQQGMAFGTVSYAPPEWIAPETMDPVKWDIYALGVVFYEMLTGTLAFPVSGQGTARQQAMQVIVAKQGHAPLDPGDAYHDDLRTLIGDMTRADAAVRISDIGEVVGRVSRLSGDLKRAHATLAPTADLSSGVPSVLTPDLSGRVAPARSRPAGRLLRRVSLTTTPLSLPGKVFGPVVLAFGGVGAFVVGLLIAVGSGTAALWVLTRPPPERGVKVVADSVVADTPLDVVLSGGKALGRDPSGAFLFEEVEPGPVRVKWAAGPGCEAEVCPSDDCPAWCSYGDQPIDLAPGAGAFVVRIEPTLPAPREVEIELPHLSDPDRKVDAWLGPSQGLRTATGLRFAGVAPGRHPLKVTLDGCGGDPACAAALDLVVPVRGPPSPASLDLAVPTPSEPAEEAPAPRSRKGRLVTTGALSAFVAQNPDLGVLWTASGAADAPATGITPFLAREYCKGRGGLLPADAAPRNPAEGMFEMEVRVDGAGRIVILETLDENSARMVENVAQNAKLTVAGFRCAQ